MFNICCTNVENTSGKYRLQKRVSEFEGNYRLHCVTRVFLFLRCIIICGFIYSDCSGCSAAHRRHQDPHCLPRGELPQSRWELKNGLCGPIEPSLITRDTDGTDVISVNQVRSSGMKEHIRWGQVRCQQSEIHSTVSRHHKLHFQ